MEKATYRPSKLLPICFYYNYNYNKEIKGVFENNLIAPLVSVGVEQTRDYKQYSERKGQVKSHPKISTKQKQCHL